MSPRRERKGVYTFSKSIACVIAAIGVAAMLAAPISQLAAEDVADGFLKVNSNPYVPTMISVDGVRLNGWEIKKLPIAQGEHTVEFTDLPGYITPAPKVVNVLGGETTTVIADFTLLGNLRVITEPAVKSTIFVDGQARNDWGAWFWIMPGIHEVSFGDVSGYDTPAPQKVRVRAGDNVVVTGMFAPNPDAPAPSVEYCELRVRTEPAVPTTIIVDGIERNTFGLDWMKIEPGPHTICFTDVPDYSTPSPVEVTVDAGGITEVVAEFDLEGGLRIITSPPKSATLYVNGVACDTWGVWLVLPEGRYDVSFGAIPGASHPTPAPRSVLVIPGQVTLVVGEYL